MVVNDPKISMPVLRLIGREADKLNLECYVIGGWVRDFFLHRDSTDIDIVVVGPTAGNSDTTPLPANISANKQPTIGIQLAQAVANALGRGAHLSVFRTYGTAQVKQHDIELEFVGARRESYRHDSRNPVVEDGTLQEDQNRRDFTINALAICLNSSRYGELLDPFDGLSDM